MRDTCPLDNDKISCRTGETRNEIKKSERQKERERERE